MKERKEQAKAENQQAEAETLDNTMFEVLDNVDDDIDVDVPEPKFGFDLGDDDGITFAEDDDSSFMFEVDEEGAVAFED